MVIFSRDILHEEMEDVNWMEPRTRFPVERTLFVYRTSELDGWLFTYYLSTLSRGRDSNPRPHPYHGCALTNWATSASAAKDFNCLPWVYRRDLPRRNQWYNVQCSIINSCYYRLMIYNLQLNYITLVVFGKSAIWGTLLPWDVLEQLSGWIFVIKWISDRIDYKWM